MDKKLGFGCMRLPMNEGKVDYDEFNKMIDYFMDHGFCYFDTAHGYLSGKSEVAIHDCLVSRYKREDYILTDKLTDTYFQTKEEIRPFFEEQLKICGVDYFDYYLMHAQDRDVYQHFMKCDAYQVVQELKDEGKIKHIGISFHDTADVLEMILNEHPEIEIVQIQFNYIDYYDSSVQSKKVYDVCRKYHKPILVMEPVKGGGLVRLPEKAKKVLDDIHPEEHPSYASYAIRFAASFDGVVEVLSGMSNLEQLQDNVRYMEDFKALDDEEMKAIDEVRKILKKNQGIPCTACRYCVDGCPMNISIPDLFSCYNAKKQFHDWNSSYYYDIYTKTNGKASDCIKCGACEMSCPQHLKIRDLLEEVSKTFE